LRAAEHTALKGKGLLMEGIRRDVTVLYAVAVTVNYPWELAQAPLFTAESHGTGILLHCFVASLGDGILVLALFALGWLVFRRQDWFARPGLRGYALLVTSGAAVALIVEWIALHLLRRWTYTDAMPRLPGLDIGILPILQMVLLPPVVFRISAWLRT
jgi:hypothetical protein